MTHNRIDLPDNVIEEIEYSWGKNKNYQASSFNEAQAKFYELTGYGLKLYWLGNIGKLNPQSTAVFQWITENFVPIEIQERNPINNIYDFKFKNENFSQLLEQTLTMLWDNYKEIPNNDLPAEPVKKFSFKGMFKK